MKNYQSTIILLVSIILGGIIGFILGEKATILKPFGDIFINLLFVIIVPLIFLTITTAIIKMPNPKRLGKIFSRIILIFIIASIISALIGIFATSHISLVEPDNSHKILELLDNNNTLDTKISFLERSANLLTVNDFSSLLSKDNIIALLLFAIIFALAIRKSKEKGQMVAQFLESLNTIILNVVNIIMYYAPIGLGCYIATLTSTYGQSITIGFVKTFLIYTLVCLFIYFGIYSLYALIASGKKGFKTYWKNILTPTITALATCSSAACIPINIKATTKMGVSSDIAETTIPMGTSFHKDGSVVGSVFKIMFLVNLFHTNPSFLKILGVALFSTILVTAIPIGGGTISEMFILSLMNFPAAALPILTIIATIIDAPATVLNVVGDASSSLLVGRLVDGPNFLKPKNASD